MFVVRHSDGMRGSNKGDRTKNFDKQEDRGWKQTLEIIDRRENSARRELHWRKAQVIVEY